MIKIPGGDIEFEKYEDLEAAFAKEVIHPGDLKAAAEVYINKLLDPIRKAFESDPNLKTLSSKAYPPPGKEKKQGNFYYLFYFLKIIALNHQNYFFNKKINK